MWRQFASFGTGASFGLHQTPPRATIHTPSMSCEFSLVIPVFNEAYTLPTLMERVTKMLKSLTESYELIFVDDGSRDNSVAVLDGYRARVRG